MTWLSWSNRSSEKLARALDNDLGRVKDRNGRDTIRTAEE